MLVLFSCNSGKTIEVETISNHINALNVKQSNYGPEYIKYDALAIEDSRTLLTYKITNYTDKTYYFNVEGYQKLAAKPEYIQINNALLVITDKNGMPVVPKVSCPSISYDPAWLYSQYLGYKYPLDYKKNNFIIFPNQSLYFEWFVVLPFGNLLEGVNYSVILDEQKKYFAQILIGSTSNRKYISRTDLRTIEENNYEIFDGILTSKNKIPVIIANP